MTAEELKEKIVTVGEIPRHIAIIMDGNGRWAKSRNLPRVAGHREGINSVREITRVCGELGVDVLTLYTFSSENWARPLSEISALMNLLVETIRREIDDLMANNVKLNIIGRLEDLPEKPRNEMKQGIKRTSKNTGLNLVLALNYGGRTEILDAIKSLFQKIEQGELTVRKITEDRFSSLLYTGKISVSDPDLLIRTGGEFRISNFLLWQAAYTEIYFTSVYWPDFRSRELYKAILNYQQRERRFGQVSEQIKKSRLR